jgi:hypothetical protein
MRYFLVIIFILVVSTLSFGLYTKEADPSLGELCIGLSVVGLFFLWMPLFIYHRWKDKDIKKYMLTKENIEKMQQEGEDKKL